MQAAGTSTGPNVCVRKRPVGESAVHCKLPDEAPLAGESRLGDIEEGLKSLVNEIRERKIRSIAIPPLGSGLGGLSWGDVRPRILKALAPLADLSVLVFEPSALPRRREKPRRYRI